MREVREMRGSGWDMERKNRRRNIKGGDLKEGVGKSAEKQNEET